MRGTVREFAFRRSAAGISNAEDGCKGAQGNRPRIGLCPSQGEPFAGFVRSLCHAGIQGFLLWRLPGRAGEAFASLPFTRASAGIRAAGREVQERQGEPFASYGEGNRSPVSSAVYAVLVSMFSPRSAARAGEAFASFPT